MGLRTYLPDLPKLLLNALPSNLSALLEALCSKVSAGVACSVSANSQNDHKSDIKACLHHVNLANNPKDGAQAG